MKKVLEGELLSIVHRVLQMKDTDVDKLYVEAKELYEKLQILKFYQDNLALGLVKDITEDQLVEKLSTLTHAQAQEELAEIGKEIYPEEKELRSQIPSDLLVEDYPLVVEAEKEVVVDFSLELETEEEILMMEEEEMQEQDEEIQVDNVLEEEIEIDEEELEESNEEEEDEEENWTEEDKIELKEEVLEEVIVEEEESFEEVVFVQEEQEEPIEEFAPLTANQKEDNPFEGFDFGEIEFIRIEDVSKENAILIDDLSFERVDADKPSLAEPEENQDTASFFAQNKTEQEAEKHKEDTIQEEKLENQQNMLFNLEHVSVREPRIVKKSINDIYRGSIMVGLNDRIAFEKHLFANSSEDFNRVLSQLNTVGTFDEARSFVEHLVKPEYNNWDGKEEYAERFMALIEKRFE
ncbi:hypothetical protein [Myroides odoratus]|uniref:hypothetical protein n=1 Tax=Myroides odoratus TaxID=256 RepID=UPI0039B021B9